MKRFAIAFAVAALAAAATGPAMAGSCPEAAAIRAAFEPRLNYERKRAEQLVQAGADWEWPAEIVDGFESVEAKGVACRTVYRRFDDFLADVIERNDRLEADGPPRMRGINIFRKW